MPTLIAKPRRQALPRALGWLALALALALTCGCDSRPQEPGSRLRSWTKRGDIQGDGSRGYVRQDGSWQIRPGYDIAHEFSEELALVGSQGFTRRQYYYITPSGKKVISKIRFDSGEIVKSEEWYGASSFSHGVALVALPGRYVIIDKTGRALAQVAADVRDSVPYDCMTHRDGAFSDGLAVIPRQELYGAIDVTGKWFIEPTYDRLWRFQHGLAVARKLQGDSLQCGVIDTTGRVILPMEFNEVYIADKSHFVVVQDGQTGILRVDGVWTVPLTDARISGFENGIGIITFKNGERRLIEPNGLLGAPLPWAECGYFSEGLCQVWSPHQAGYIDRTGALRFTVPSHYTFQGRFHHGLAEIIDKETGDICLIDTTGKVLWKDRITEMSWP